MWQKELPQFWALMTQSNNWRNKNVWKVKSYQYNFSKVYLHQMLWIYSIFLGTFPNLIICSHHQYSLNKVQYSKIATWFFFVGAFVNNLIILLYTKSISPLFKIFNLLLIEILRYMTNHTQSFVCTYKHFCYSNKFL